MNNMRVRRRRTGGSTDLGIAPPPSSGDDGVPRPSAVGGNGEIWYRSPSSRTLPTTGAPAMTRSSSVAASPHSPSSAAFNPQQQQQAQQRQHQSPPNSNAMTASASAPGPPKDLHSKSMTLPATDRRAGLLSQPRNSERKLKNRSKSPGKLSVRNLWGRSRSPEANTTKKSDLIQLITQQDWNSAIQKMQAEPDAVMNKHHTSLQGYKTQAYPLHVAACYKPTLTFVQKLLDLNPRAASAVDDQCGRLPLHWACISGSPVQVLQLLMDSYTHGVKIIDKVHGRLPLHYIVIHATKLKQVTCLLTADPRATAQKDKSGKAPLDLAEESQNSGKKEIVREVRRVIDELNISKQGQKNGRHKESVSNVMPPITADMDGRFGDSYHPNQHPINGNTASMTRMSTGNSPPLPSNHVRSVSPYRSTSPYRSRSPNARHSMPSSHLPPSSASAGAAAHSNYISPGRRTPPPPTTTTTTTTTFDNNSSAFRRTVAPAPASGGYLMERDNWQQQQQLLQQAQQQFSSRQTASSTQSRHRASLQMEDLALVPLPSNDRQSTWHHSSPAQSMNRINFMEDSSDFQRLPTTERQQTWHQMTMNNNDANPNPNPNTMRKQMNNNNINGTNLGNNDNGQYSHQPNNPMQQNHYAQDSYRQDQYNQDQYDTGVLSSGESIENAMQAAHIHRMGMYARKMDEYSGHLEDVKGGGEVKIEQVDSGNQQSESQSGSTDSIGFQLVQDMKTNMGKLNSKVKQRRQNIDQKDREIAEIDLEIEKLQRQQQTLNNEYNEVQSNFMQQQNLVNQKRDRVSELNLRIAQLQQQLAKEKQEMESAETELYLQQEILTQHNDKVQQIEDEHGSLIAIKQALRDEKQSIAREVENCESELKSLETIQALARGDQL